MSGRAGYVHHIPLCHTLQLYDLHEIYCLFYDYIYEKLPPFFHYKLTLFSSRHSTMLLCITYRRTNLAPSSMFHTLPNIWNPLPEELKTNLQIKRNFL